MSRKFYILFFSFFIVSQNYGQSEISNGFFNPGESIDLIKTNLVELPIDNKSGRGITWNYMLLASPFIQEIEFKVKEAGKAHDAFPSADLVSIGMKNEEVYYKITENNVYQLGSYGPDQYIGGEEILVDYDVKALIKKGGQQFADRYNDKTSYSHTISVKELSELGIEELPFMHDYVRFDVEITRDRIIDGQGDLLLPFGRYEVVREREEVRVEINAFVEGDMGWKELDFDIKSQDKIKLGVSNYTNYYFWSERFKWPVLSLEELNNSYSATYINESSSPVKRRVKPNSKEIIAYPNPTLGDINFELINYPAGKYRLQIYNVFSNPIYHEEFNLKDRQPIKTDLSFLSWGTYLYSIIDSSGKRLATRRVVILRP